MKLKRVLTTVVSGILSVCLLAGCGGTGNNTAVNSGNGSDNSGSSDDYVLKIGYGGGICEAPIHIAVENGYFDNVGLKYEMVKVDAAETVSAVGSKQIDAGFGMIGKFVSPIENGLPIRMVAGLDKGCTKVLVKKDSGIKKIEDLKGKKLGVPGLAAAPSIILKRSLTKAGIDITPGNGDVEWAVYGMTDLPSALDNGAIDAAGVSDPTSSIAIDQYDFEYLIDTATDDDYKDEYCCAIFLTDDIIQNHPQIAEKFTKAVMLASLWVNDNVEETTKIQTDKKWVAGDAQFNSQILEGYDFSPSIQGGYEALKAVIPELQAIQLISEETDINELVDRAYYISDKLTDEEIYKEYEETLGNTKQ